MTRYPMMPWPTEIRSTVFLAAPLHISSATRRVCSKESLLLQPAELGGQVEQTHNHLPIARSCTLKSHCKAECVVCYYKPGGAYFRAAYNHLVKHINYSSIVGKPCLILVWFLLL